MILQKRLLKEKRMKQKDFAQLLGVDETTVSLISNGFRPMPDEMRRALDEMFGADFVAKYEVQKFTEPTQVSATILPSEIVEEVEERVRQQMGIPKREDIEVIEAEEVELKVTPILTPDIINQPGVDIKEGIEQGTLPVITKPTQDIVPEGVVKVYLENDEMAPDIEANDPVLIRWMDTIDAVIPGRMYFVDLYRGAVVRWLFPQQDGTLLLRSKNAPDMIVAMDSVKSISEVVSIWKRPKCMPTEHHTMYEELRRRDDQMDELLAQHGRLIGIIEKK